MHGIPLVMLERCVWMHRRRDEEAQLSDDATISEYFSGQMYVRRIDQVTEGAWAKWGMVDSGLADASTGPDGRWMRSIGHDAREFPAQCGFFALCKYDCLSNCDCPSLLPGCRLRAASRPAMSTALPPEVTQ